jgi:sugar phosphate isomerase/epimerase
MDTMGMLGRMGSRLAHLHLADGSGSNSDEHLVPGRGNQPCAEILGLLGRNGFDGNVVLEVNTRRATTQEARDADLAEALTYARRHLVLGDADSAGETKQITV